MKIVDCRTAAAFDQVCQTLAAEIRRGQVQYDLIVGIATGGRIVAEQVLSHLGHPGAYIVVKRQRPGTKSKERLKGIRHVLKRLPSFANDRLRSLEMAVSEWRFERTRGKPRKMVTMDVLQDCALNAEDVHNILVIDDAVDSGATLVDVCDYLKARFPVSKVQSAALTVTHRHPLIWPDYLAHKRSILKFPWSLDG